MQRSVCHSCQSPDRDLSTLSGTVRQMGAHVYTHTHTEQRGRICMSTRIHADVNNTTSRLVRADDN